MIQMIHWCEYTVQSDRQLDCTTYQGDDKYVIYISNTVVWWPISVGGLDFEYARSPRQLNGNKFFVPGRT